eukprot:1249035-Prymnesium_polylepis.1
MRAQLAAWRRARFLLRREIADAGTVSAGHARLAAGRRTDRRRAHRLASRRWRSGEPRRPPATGTARAHTHGAIAT